MKRTISKKVILSLVSCAIGLVIVATGGVIATNAILNSHEEPTAPTQVSETKFVVPTQAPTAKPTQASQSTPTVAPTQPQNISIQIEDINENSEESELVSEYQCFDSSLSDAEEYAGFQFRIGERENYRLIANENTLAYEIFDNGEWVSTFAKSSDKTYFDIPYDEEFYKLDIEGNPYNDALFRLSQHKISGVYFLDGTYAYLINYGVPVDYQTAVDDLNLIFALN